MRVLEQEVSDPFKAPGKRLYAELAERGWGKPAVKHLEACKEQNERGDEAPNNRREGSDEKEAAAGEEGVLDEDDDAARVVHKRREEVDAKAIHGLQPSANADVALAAAVAPDGSVRLGAVLNVGNERVPGHAARAVLVGP